MRIRPFLHSQDYDTVASWITDERTHALWCANRMPWPLTEDAFGRFMEEEAEKYRNTAFVATADDGRLMGFFCYSLNLDANEGMLKFVILAPEARGKGYGREMVRLAVRYAFEITRADSVQLNVFSCNEAAKKCYERTGFAVRHTTGGAFVFRDESWGRCNMAIKKMPGTSPEDTFPAGEGSLGE